MHRIPGSPTLVNIYMMVPKAMTYDVDKDRTKYCGRYSFAILRIFRRTHDRVVISLGGAVSSSFEGERELCTLNMAPRIDRITMANTEITMLVDHDVSS
jgi:hypothetical protein